MSLLAKPLYTYIQPTALHGMSMSPHSRLAIRSPSRYKANVPQHTWPGLAREKQSERVVYALDKQEIAAGGCSIYNNGPRKGYMYEWQGDSSYIIQRIMRRMTRLMRSSSWLIAEKSGAVTKTRCVRLYYTTCKFSTWKQDIAAHCLHVAQVVAIFHATWHFRRQPWLICGEL